MTPAPQPSRRQARVLVTCIAVAWTVWPIGAIGIITGNGVLIAPTFPIFFVACIALYQVYYAVWQPVTGHSFWSMTVRPWTQYSRRSLRAHLGLLNPRWWLSTLRHTGWPVVPVATILVALLVLDLVVFGVGMGTSATHHQ